MAQSKTRPSDDEIAQRIGEILEAIRTPEHADDIIEIRKIVRKNVPFFFRSYFAAYLLKDSLAGGARPGQRDRDRNRKDGQAKRDQVREQPSPRGGKPPAQEPKQKRPDQQPKPRQESARQESARQESVQEERKNERMLPLPEGVEAATLFVSAGRKRHFYPRHLLELFAGADIPRESIGEIRLFDNYTFVQILASDAPKAVANLDGAAFKGRKLTVNFARKKEEGADDASRDAPSPDERDDSRSERGLGYGPDEGEDGGDRGDSGYRDSDQDGADSFDDTIDDADETDRDADETGRDADEAGRDADEAGRDADEGPGDGSSDDSGSRNGGRDDEGEPTAGA